MTSDPGDWTLGDWTHIGKTSFGITGSTSPLVFNEAAVIGREYMFSYGFAEYNLSPIKGSITITHGGHSVTNTYDPGSTIKYTATTTASLTVTPSINFSGTVTLSLIAYLEYVHLYEKAKNEGIVKYITVSKPITHVSTISSETPGINGGILFTCPSHGYLTGYEITISGISGDSPGGSNNYNGTRVIEWISSDQFAQYFTPPVIFDKDTPGALASRKVLANTAGSPLLENAYNPLIGGDSLYNIATLPLSGGSPISGGTPDDEGLREAIEYIKTTKGYKFNFLAYPEIAQIGNPWRGTVLPAVKTIPQFLDGIKTQCLFYANKLVTWNLKPYSFVLGSELIEINRHKTYIGGGAYTDDTGAFNFTSVAKWKEIYTAVQAVFIAAGWTDIYVGYSCDRSELLGFGDDQGYWWRPLDELIMHQNACFINGYYTVTEEASNNYADYVAGWTEGRDYYPGYYVTDYYKWKAYDVTGQAPMTASEYALKDLNWWWNNAHDHVGKGPTYPRTATPWTVQARPIMFVEIGCPSVDSGGTEPYIYYNPANINSGIPRGSSLRESPITQYLYIKSLMEKIVDTTLPIKCISLWHVDSRPMSTLTGIGAFFWGDSFSVPYNHWLKYNADLYKSLLRHEMQTTDDLGNTLTQLYRAELYKITLSEGTIVYYTNSDVNILYRGNTYIAIPIKRDSIASSVNLKLDPLSLTIGIAGLTINGYTIPQIVNKKWLNKASVYISLVDPIVPILEFPLYDGIIDGELYYDQGTITLECNVVTDLLNNTFPKIIYSEVCQHKLYDIRCGIKAYGEGQEGVVSEDISKSIVKAVIFLFTNKPKGLWLGGTITFTSSANNGITRTINVHDNGSVIVSVPFPYTIDASATFTATIPAYAESGTITDNSGSNVVLISSVFAFANKPQGFWVGGLITLTSGRNYGNIVTVTQHNIDTFVTVAEDYLYDLVADDTFDAATSIYTQNGVVSEDISKSIVKASIFNFSTTKPQGYWVGGTVTFTSSANNGITRTISVHDNGSVKVSVPFTYTIEASATFSASSITYAEVGTITALAGDSFSIIAAVFAFTNHASKYWEGGTLTFTSGDNVDVARSIKIHEDGKAFVREPYPDAFQVGDTFVVIPGCDKQGSTCVVNFKNYDNFFGFEDIPRPEQVYGL